MKRKVCALLSVFTASAMILTACGGNTTTESKTEPETTVEETTEEPEVEETAEPEAEEEAEETEEEAPEEVVEVKEPTLYEDPNGWTLKYYEDSFDVTQENGMVAFVYKGESAGTNMLSVTYDVDTTNPEEVADKLVKEWGDSAEKSEGIFPGTESVPCFRASLPVAEDGSGLYMEAIIRSYMQGCLVFELTGHNSGDDELDMAVSDNLAMLIDSVEFTQYMDSEADHAMTTDIEGCETFTQIVDKLADGTGYANAQISGEDVLLVASGTYDNGEGKLDAIDAEIFCYKDGVPTYVGFVTAGGTAYPLAVKDDMLYVGSNRGMQKYEIKDGKLQVHEFGSVDYDEDSNEHYAYNLDDGNDYAGMDQEEAQKKLTGLYDEFEAAEVVEFSAVSK